MKWYNLFWRFRTWFFPFSVWTLANDKKTDTYTQKLKILHRLDTYMSTENGNRLWCICFFILDFSLPNYIHKVQFEDILPATTWEYSMGFQSMPTLIISKEKLTSLFGNLYKIIYCYHYYYCFVCIFFLFFFLFDLLFLLLLACLLMRVFKFVLLLPLFWLVFFVFFSRLLVFFYKSAVFIATGAGTGSSYNPLLVSKLNFLILEFYINL